MRTAALRSIALYFCSSVLILVCSPALAQEEYSGAFQFGESGPCDGVVGPGDLADLEIEIAGGVGNYTGCTPASPDIQDLDGDGVIGPGDVVDLELWITGNYGAGNTGKPFAIDNLTPDVYVNAGGSVELCVEVYDDPATGDMNPTPRAGWGVNFAIDPASDCPTAELDGRDPSPGIGGGKDQYILTGATAYEYTDVIANNGEACVKLFATGCLGGDVIDVDVWIPGDGEAMPVVGSQGRFPNPLVGPPSQVTVIGNTPIYGWTKRIGGNDQEWDSDWGRAIAVDGSGNVYLAGGFMDTVNFGEDWGEVDIKTPSGAGDIFVTRINSDGSYGWTRRIQNEYFSAWYLDFDVAADVSGNVYVTGYFSGVVDFDDDFGGGLEDPKTSAGGKDIFVVKINPDGSYGWARRIGGTGDDRSRGISTDGSGNVYVTGWFNDVVDFDEDFGGGIEGPKTSSGGREIFVTRINSRVAIRVMQFQRMGSAMFTYQEVFPPTRLTLTRTSEVGTKIQ